MPIEIKLIREGDPVSPGIANTPLEQLQQALNQLRQWFDEARIGSTLFARRMPTEGGLLVGTPVYLDPVEQIFRAGLAQFSTVNDVVMPSDTSQVWGVLHTKYSDTIADILLYGYSDLDISGVVSGDVEAGLYYLSGSNAGFLTKTRSPVAVPVLQSDGNGKVLVRCDLSDKLSGHQHYRIELSTAPAGEHTPPLPGNKHVITNPDSGLRGWLPASHEIFDGKAPVHAVFGYNLSQHASLADVWPPVPLNHAYMEMDRGEDTAQGYQGVPLGPDGLVVLDRNGIWWMSDCWNDAPWHVNLDTSESQIAESQGGECPRVLTRSIVLWFSKMTAAGSGALVTSLTSADSRVLVRCAGTEQAAARGDLDISLNLSLGIADVNETGAQVVKGMIGDVFQRGPVVEGIYTDDSDVSLSGTLSRRLVPNDDDSPMLYQGAVCVRLVSPLGLEIPANWIRLEGATEEHNPFMYVGFPAGRTASYTVRYDVPIGAANGSMLRVAFRLLGKTSGDFPPLTLSYLRIQRPDVSPESFTSSYTSLPLDTTATLGSPNMIFEAVSDEFEVAAGDLVFIKVTRNGADDEYSGEIGVAQQIGILNA